MTLRLRLVLVLLSLVIAGLVVSDVFTFTSLRSDLTGQLDQELQGAVAPVTRALLRAAGEGGMGFQPFGGSASLPPRDVQLPPGTFGELRDSAGRVLATDFISFGGTTPPVPDLPSKLPGSGRSTTIDVYLSTGSSGSLSYRVLALPLTQAGGTVVIAIPLTSETATLHDLLLVEGLVSAAVVAALALLTWWVVRHGLYPLEKMASTADEIAAGDLSRRIELDHPDTEVGRLGTALNSMLGEIEDALAARAASEARLRRFLADASHELRTPLTAIRGFAEMFDRGAAGRPEDLGTSMRHIRAEADRMSELVEELFLLARLDRERPLERRPVDLGEVAAQAVDAAQAGAGQAGTGQAGAGQAGTGQAGAGQAGAHPISLEIPGQAGVATVVGDAGRLRRVVDNLLTNAIRHTPPGTPVIVRVHRQDGEVRLEVADRGPGIAPGDRMRIFEPFRRADPSRSRSTGGTGLGLAIVRAIVRAHGGEVGLDVRSLPSGAGADAAVSETVFWVRVPAAGIAAGAAGAAAHAPEIPSGNGAAGAGAVDSREAPSSPTATAQTRGA